MSLPTTIIATAGFLIILPLLPLLPSHFERALHVIVPYWKNLIHIIESVADLYIEMLDFLVFTSIGEHLPFPSEEGVSDGFGGGLNQGEGQEEAHEEGRKGEGKEEQKDPTQGTSLEGLNSLASRIDHLMHRIDAIEPHIPTTSTSSTGNPNDAKLALAVRSLDSALQQPSSTHSTSPSTIARQSANRVQMHDTASAISTFLERRVSAVEMQRADLAAAQSLVVLRRGNRETTSVEGMVDDGLVLSLDGEDWDEDEEEGKRNDGQSEGLADDDDDGEGEGEFVTVSGDEGREEGDGGDSSDGEDVNIAL